ncbi:hypothetical protein STEG23_034114 [Scotinomys teguina]
MKDEDLGGRNQKARCSRSDGEKVVLPKLNAMDKEDKSEGSHPVAYPGPELQTSYLPSPPELGITSRPYQA